MNYQKLNIILIGLIILLLLIGRSDSSAHQSNYKLIEKLEPTILPSPTPTPTPPPPVRFMIPKLGIDAGIEPVGNDNNGVMLLPQETDKVGWYYLGFKPGEKGNAVIGGHLDLVTGAPAVFYNLRSLAIGDIIEVVDEHGTQRIFTVVRTQSYPYDEAPINEIFDKSDYAHLNLITCTGIFNQTTHNYSHRLVIYTTLLN